MRVLVLGASGRTGRIVVRRALEAGHDVIALVRSLPPATSSKVQPFPTHARLTVLVGDVFAPESFAASLPHVDVVMSVLGPKGSDPKGIFSAALPAVVSSFHARGTKRFVLTSEDYKVAACREARPFFRRVFINPLFRKRVHADMEKLHQWVLGKMALPGMPAAPTSGVTLVQPYSLFNSPRDFVEPGTSANKIRKCTFKVSREALARFIVSEAWKPAWDRQFVAVHTR